MSENRSEKQINVIACERHKPALAALAEAVETGSVEDEAMNQLLQAIEDCVGCSRALLNSLLPYLPADQTVH